MRHTASLRFGENQMGHTALAMHEMAVCGG